MVMMFDPWWKDLSEKERRNERRMLHAMEKSMTLDDDGSIQMIPNSPISKEKKNLFRQLLRTRNDKPMYRVGKPIHGSVCPLCNSKRLAWMECDVYASGLPDYLIVKQPELKKYKHKEYQHNYKEESVVMCTDCGEIIDIFLNTN